MSTSRIFDWVILGYFDFASVFEESSLSQSYVKLERLTSNVFPHLGSFNDHIIFFSLPLPWLTVEITLGVSRRKNNLDLAWLGLGNRGSRKSSRIVLVLLPVIGPQNSRRPLNQSDSKLKSITTWSPASSRASGSLLVFPLRSHGPFETFSFPVTSSYNYFGFGSRYPIGKSSEGWFVTKLTSWALMAIL